MRRALLSCKILNELDRLLETTHTVKDRIEVELVSL